MKMIHTDYKLQITRHRSVELDKLDCYVIFPWIQKKENNQMNIFYIKYQQEGLAVPSSAIRDAIK